MHASFHQTDEPRFIQRVAECLDRDCRGRMSWRTPDPLRQCIADLHHLQEQCRRLHAFANYETGAVSASLSPKLAEQFQDASRTLHASRSNVPLATLQNRLVRKRRAICFAAAEQLCEDARSQVADGTWGLIEQGADGAARVYFRGRMQARVAAADLLAEIESGRVMPLDPDQAEEEEDDCSHRRVYDFTITRETKLARAVLFRSHQRQAGSLLDRFVPALRSELRLLRGVYLESASFQEIPGYCVALGPYVLMFESDARRTGPSWGYVLSRCAVLASAVWLGTLLARSWISPPPAAPTAAPSVVEAPLEATLGLPASADRAEEARLLRQLWESAPRE